MIYECISKLVVLLMMICLSICQQTCKTSVCICSNNVCTACISSIFYLNSSLNTCQLCDFRCSTCSQTNRCLICTSGYYLNQSNTNTINCQSCPLYCSSCSNSSSCDICMSGYVLVNKECQPCPIAYTQSCLSLTTVTSCISGYWQNGDSCSPCRQFCISCSSSTNCFACAEGYHVLISAGAYCSACANGCKTCTSSTTCIACKANFKLIGNACVSIALECINFPNCQTCAFSSSNNSIYCITCAYPYYLHQTNTSSICVLGSSILCQNGANGVSRTQCINSCSSYSQQLALGSSSNIICGPIQWIPKTDITQYFFDTTTSISELFPSILTYFSSCPSIPLFYSKYFNEEQYNIFGFNKILPPYYKLVLLVKAVPLYKEIDFSAKINLMVRMIDNSTTPQQYLTEIDSNNQTACLPIYYTVQSKHIRDQNVTIRFESKINTNSSKNFSLGLMGFSQILIQLYRCSPQCRICLNSKYCIECYSQLFSYQNQCVQECYGFYEFYSPLGNPFNFTYKSCLQTCPSKFYSTLHPSKSNVFICVTCIQPCLTCKSENQCLSCTQPYAYYDLGFACVSVCPNTHYISSMWGSNMCVSCNSPCQTCLNSSKCLSCSIGYFQNKSQTCVGTCPLGYFANVTSKSCETCDSKCSLCINAPDNCLACSNGYFLRGNACLVECPIPNYYPSTISNQCEICKPPCLECLSQKQCLSCVSGFLLLKICYQQCPNGYFGNLITNTCNKCTNSECLRCSSPNTCQLCANSTYLYSSQCIYECPSGTFPAISLNDGNKCLPCLTPCYQCLNSSYCLSCQIGFMSQLQPGRCISLCESGYYSTQTVPINSTNALNLNKVCALCLPQCQTCKNNQTCITCKNASKLRTPDNQCQDICPQGYYNQSGICSACAYPCFTCINTPQNCLTCFNPYILTKANICVSQCAAGEYQKDQECFSCAYPCYTCSSIINCTSCQLLTNPNGTNQQTYLWGASCLSQCPQTTYADPSTLKCKSCNFPCATCLDNLKCLTCLSGYLNPTKYSCQMCPQTSFPNLTTGICQLCNSTLSFCSICQSQSLCTQCIQNYYLYNNSCITSSNCSLITNHYPNSMKMACQICPAPCYSCLNASFCTSCLSGLLLNNKCVTECPIGFYSSLSASICLACNSTKCATCNNNPNFCLSCNQIGLYPIFVPSNNTCISSLQCPSSYFIDYSYGYGRCINCQPPCLACTSWSTCISCIVGILFSGQCRASCPIGYYESISNQTQQAECLQCSTNCLQCRSSPDKCISCPQSKYLQISTCVNECNSTFYLDQDTLACKPCKSPCQTCSSASICLSCLQVDENGQNLTSNIIYFGQCLSACPDGTYQNGNTCSKCPSTCQLCSSTGGTVLCKKCASGLLMNSSSPGICSTSCQETQYPDLNTRSCYACQAPCVACLSATSCTFCVDGYILYGNNCIKGTLCPEDTFKQFDNASQIHRCVDKCTLPYFGSSFTRQCVSQCPYNYVKYQKTALCLPQCPKYYYLSSNLLCHSCSSKQSCSSLLWMEVRAKSIFNVLYVRINFNKQINIKQIFQGYVNSQSPLIEVTFQYLQQNSLQRRMLEASSSEIFLNYTINPLESINTIWLKIATSQSIGSIQINIALSSHYLFSNQVLQNTNGSSQLSSYDQYSETQINEGKRFEIYSKIVSLAMCILFLLNLIFNTGYLMYLMIDFYQLLFLLLFLDTDYPPILNYFLYGFRYSHYLFLPQIFTKGQTSIPSSTPQKIGILVPDADFLNNTGHDFLIMFTVAGLFSLLKLCDFIHRCFEGQNRSNRIYNHKQSRKEHSLRQQSQQSSIHNQSKQSQVNKIEKQIAAQHEKSQEQQGFRLMRFIKIVVNRVRWNYFNDFLYSLYFYLMLFAFCQTYHINFNENIITPSNIFAIIFVILGIAWPIGLALFLYYKNSNGEVFVQQFYSNQGDKLGDYQYNSNNKYYEQYKCYVASLKPKASNFTGLLYSPFKYFRKLILSALFAYCSNYESFIMGVIITFGIVFVIVSLIYRPFKNKLQLFSNCIFEIMFSAGCVCVYFLMSSFISFSIITKSQIAVAAALIFLLLSLLICIYNVLMIVLQTIFYFTGENYLDQFNQTDTEIENVITHQKTQKQANQPILTYHLDEESNLRLNVGAHQVSNDGEQVTGLKIKENEEQESEGMDIYLKKENKKAKAPQILIKCIKNDENEGNMDKSQEESQYQNQNDEGWLGLETNPQYGFKKESNQIQRQEQTQKQKQLPQGKLDKVQEESHSQQNNNIFNSIVNPSMGVQQFDMKGILQLSDQQGIQSSISKQEESNNKNLAIKGKSHSVSNSY